MKESNKTREDGGRSRLDSYLRALSDEHRRYLLYCLDEHRVTDIEELARYIVTQNSDRPPSAILEEEYQPVQTKLHRQHLPRSKEYGIIDYDERNKDVRLDNPPQSVKVLLHLFHFIERQWE